MKEHLDLLREKRKAKALAKSPLKRSRKPLKARAPLKRVSAKQAAKNRLYAKQRIEYLQSHPVCEVCNSKPATQIHHRHRRGIYTNSVEFFLAVCFECHEKIETNGKWARANGYILD